MATRDNAYETFVMYSGLLDGYVSAGVDHNWHVGNDSTAVIVFLAGELHNMAHDAVRYGNMVRQEYIDEHDINILPISKGGESVFDFADGGCVVHYRFPYTLEDFKDRGFK